MNRLRDLYLLIANSLLLAAVLLVLLHVVVTWRNRETPIRYENLSAETRDNYRHLSATDVVDLLNATYKPHGTGWTYESWVGYRESERSSKFINVNRFGIRSNGQPRDDLSVLNGATWFLGGSTTFGYGVTDGETIPAQLETIVGEPVVNLGRGYFYSAQENYLLKHLLTLGYRPRRAVFLDGINERCDIENYQRELGELFTQATFNYAWNYSEIIKPLLYVRDRLAFRLAEADHKPNLSGEFSCQDYGATAQLDNVLFANLQERELICTHYGVECVTFVQPFAGVHGIHRDAAALVPSNRELLRRKYFYLEPAWGRAHARFIVDAFDTYDRHAFIDDVHYSADASRVLAARIATELQTCPAGCDTDTEATTAVPEASRRTVTSASP